MSKKSLLIIGLIGIVIILTSFFLNPSLIENIVYHGKSISPWRSFQIHIIQLFLFAIGIAIVLVTFVFSYILKEGKTKFYLLSVCIIGVGITVIGIISNSSFFQKSLNIYQLEIETLHAIYNLQLTIITIGCLIFAIPLFIYIFRFLKAKKTWGIISVSFILIIYLVLIYSNFIDKRYPNNVILKTSSYSKIFDLLVGRDILLSDYEPRSTLIVGRKHITKAKYPVIDINFHLNSSFQTENDKMVLEPENLVRSMDSVGIKIIVNTDGLWGNLERYTKLYPDRFINFYPSGFPAGVMSDERLAELPENLEKAVEKGVRGDGELWKNLGLKTRDSSGKVIPVDDPRLDPLWDKAAELGVPILWHMGDPAAFFQPINKYNERYEELRRIPEWSYYGPQFPKREEILKQRENVFKKHSRTIFIGCHFGFNPENLKYVSYLLDTYPNYYVELSTVLSDLGKQPYTARKFFIKYQDRILFGSDGGNGFNEKGWTIEKYYRAYFEFLETSNEYISYPLQGVINQGNWKIYGIDLPDSVLEKVYYKNAEKILFPNRNK